ncbi:nitroreductase family protein [Alkaliphilus metalliredigens]|nr:nitroreductase family protein [Alkaliphilus metalliredigens]
MQSVDQSLQLLKDIRSIRKYKKDPVSRSILEQIIDCGRMSPTAKNQQPWEFIIVDDKKLLTALGEVTPHGEFLKNAPACIAVFTKTSSSYYIEDGSAATQTILIAARLHGLKSCWIAGNQGSYDGEEIPLCEGIPCYEPKNSIPLTEEVQKILKTPQDLQLISIVSIGYSDESPIVEKRPLEEVIHWNQF